MQPKQESSMRVFSKSRSVRGALVRWLSVSIGVFCLTAVPALAQPGVNDTATFVKVHGVADRPDETGRRVVTISLEINEKYLLIGDKVPEDLAQSRFRVKFLVNGKPAEAEITYPRGKIIKDKFVGDYTTYEGKVTCTGTIQRVAGDTSPIEVVITMQGFPQEMTY